MKERYVRPKVNRYGDIEQITLAGSRRRKCRRNHKHNARCQGGSIGS